MFSIKHVGAINIKRTVNNEQNQLRRSKRIKTIKCFGQDFIVYLV